MGGGKLKKDRVKVLEVGRAGKEVRGRIKGRRAKRRTIGYAKVMEGEVIYL